MIYSKQFSSWRRFNLCNAPEEMEIKLIDIIWPQIFLIKGPNYVTMSTWATGIVAD